MIPLLKQPYRIRFKEEDEEIKAKWKEIMGFVDGMPEPNYVDVMDSKREHGGHHTGKGFRHGLEVLAKYLPVEGNLPQPWSQSGITKVFSMKYHWAVCPECKLIRWRRVIAYNNYTCEFYERVFFQDKKTPDKSAT